VKSFSFFLALGLIGASPVFARMGDSVAQTVARYGQPVSSTSPSGELTSTRTFTISGLQVTCGYVGGKVEMETYARDDRNFIGPEVEALLRTNGTKRLGWTTPAEGYVNGNYKRVDGVTATLDGNKLAIQSPKWTDALAKDQAAGNKPASETSATNATSSVSPKETNAAPATTNAP
jgi:hypothetical protein